MLRPDVTGKYLVNSVLLSETCALSRYLDLKDYITNKVKTDNLFVGTGVPSLHYSEDDLHPVKSVKGNNSNKDFSRYIAIVIVSIYIAI